MLWMVKKRLSLRTAPSRINGARANKAHIIGAHIIGAFRDACHRVAFWSCRPRLVRLYVNHMLALRRSRADLAKLDPHQRADIGVSDEQITAEMRKPVLGEISSWAPLELHAAVRDSRRPSSPPPRHERSFYRARGRGDLPSRH